MTRKPYLNALCASLYIVAIVLFIDNVLAQVGVEGEKSVLIPMSMLSLLVLSVTLMAYLFFYNPLMMYFEGDRVGGMRLFLRTVGFFALFTGVIVALFLVTSIN